MAGSRGCTDIQSEGRLCVPVSLADGSSIGSSSCAVLASKAPSSIMIAEVEGTLHDATRRCCVEAHVPIRVPCLVSD